VAGPTHSDLADVVERDIRFVEVAGGTEMGGDLFTVTHVAWLNDGIGLLHLAEMMDEMEPILSADLSIVNRNGVVRPVRSIRFEDDRTTKDDHRVITLDELYSTNEHGDRKEVLMKVATRLLAEAWTA
jgi:hypothetical protein